MDVATNNTFTAFVTGYNGLNVGTSLLQDITGLAAGTTYYVRVRAQAGNCSSPNSGTLTATTQTVVSAPYVQEFTTTAVPAGFTTTGWTIGSVRGVTGNPGNNIYRNFLSAVTGTITSVNIGPLPANQQVALDYKFANYASPYASPAAGSGSFTVAVSKDFGATYTDLQTITNDGTSGWKTLEYLNLTSFQGETVKIRITGNWISGDYDLAFDNISIKAMPACFRPTALAVSAAPSTANVTWASTGDNFDIIYGAPGFNNTTAGTLVENIAVTNYQITGLTDGNYYDVYVRRDCGSTDGNSAWTGPLNFRAGYYNNSGNIPTSYNTAPTIASEFCTPEATITIAVPAGYRIASLSTKYTMTALPDVEYDPFEDEYIAAWMSEQRSMIYSTTLGAGEPQLAEGTGDVPGAFNYERTLPFANGATGNITFSLRAWRLYGLTGCNTQAQYVNAGSWQLIPTFELIPACIDPTALSLAFTSPSTANLSWAAVAGTPIGYEYAVTSSATPPASGTATTATTVTGYPGFEAGGTYYLHVRTNCTEGVYSPWKTQVFSAIYCSPTTSFAGNLYMTSFATTGGYTNITNTSGDSAYTNYSALSVSQSEGQAVNFSAALYRYSTTWTVGLNVWVDWNGDYDFDDAGEKVYTGTGTTPIASTFNVPMGTPIGSYRMRIRSEYNNTD
ncbi:MAG: hypothetical protein EOP51_26025, partial [Sphingobacteriales bacterium]